MRGTRSCWCLACADCGIIPAYAGNTAWSIAWPISLRDHPRVCGEHGTKCWKPRTPPGSSPRMRGTQGLQRQDLSRHGIIPAYAGNTLRWRHGSCRCRDHPRVCGEHLTSCVMVVSSMGSSPRMRGTLVVAELLGHESGIIPAYAGNTWNRQRQASPCWDHPRVCGEHAVLNSDALPFTGSSPRMRGTLLHHALALASGGIIPAYAGNTSTAGLCRCSARDHPRVCGEHPETALLVSFATGSSPRMRGTRAERVIQSVFSGIIPAYAGNTCRKMRKVKPLGDHPRVCGEHHATGRERVQVAGSSPRMRGTHSRCRRAANVTGIIPAYAGNTSAATIGSSVPGDHPRVCGEHARLKPDRSSTRGSSPRMRGTRFEFVPACLHLGIIPAYAGNTTAEDCDSVSHWDHPRVCGEHAFATSLLVISTGSSPRMRGTRGVHDDH